MSEKGHPELWRDGTVTSTPRRGLWVLLAGGIVLGAIMAFLTVVWASASGRGVSSGAATSIPERVAVGQPAPDFSASTPGGKMIRLSSLYGSPVALNFWATWCIPCKVEMPELQAAQERYGKDRLVVLGVNAGESAEQVEAYMQGLKITFDSVLDPQESIIDQYDIRAFPTTIWIDANGVVRAKHIGPLTRDNIDRYVSDLLQR